jgi:hypothetical protein
MPEDGGCQPGPHGEKLATTIAKSEVNLDVSASRAVNRELAGRPGMAGRIGAVTVHGLQRKQRA